MTKRIIATVLSAAMLLVSANICVFAESSNASADYFRAKIEEYENNFNDDDPQFMTDEEFFGKWDSDFGEWTIAPAFDYDRFAALSEIEAAAKNGDYDTAKEETLLYYKQRYADETYERSDVKNSKIYKLLGEMTMENLILRADMGMPMEKLTLTEEAKWFETDILERFENGFNSNGTARMNIRIYDVKKDGYMAQFWTKESDCVPYVKMIVNGTERTYYPIADTMIRAGSYLNTSYSGDPYMYANESISSINPDKSVRTLDVEGAGTSAAELITFRSNAFKPINDYTRRACLMFDFSDIKEGDEINSATMYIYGKMLEEDEDPARPQEVKTSMDVFVVDEPGNLTWQERGFCWAGEGMTVCYSYDGEYGPSICTPVSTGATEDAWSASVMHQYYSIQYMIELYRGTGDEAYMYHAIRLTINAALRLGNRFDLVRQPFLHAGTRSYELVRNLYTMIKSRYMTAEKFVIILKMMHMQNDFLVTNWTAGETGGNIGSIVTNGLLQGAMNLKEFKRYYEPKTILKDETDLGSMQGGWLEVGLYRSTYKLEDTLDMDDGSCVEVPLSYINTNLGNFIGPYEWAEAIGMRDEIAARVETKYKELLRKAAKHVLYLENPIRGTWQSGDDGAYTENNSVRISQTARFFVGEDDPVLEWAYSGGKKGSEPDILSYANDTVAKTTLRSGWSDSAVSLYMDADGGYNSHSHNDDLAVGLMAYGKYMLADPNMNLYNGDQKIVNWQHSTRAHNTIEINKATQKGHVKGTRGMSEPFGEEMNFPDSLAGLGSLNPGSRYLGKLFDYVKGNTLGYQGNNVSNGNFEVSRDVLFIKPGYFVVTDFLKPENSDVNTYKQSWHLYHDMPYEVEPETKNIVSKSPATANIVIAPVDSADEITVSAHMGVYNPGRANTGVSIQREYTTYDKSKSGVATYNTILYPTRTGEEVSIETANLPLDVAEDTASAFSANIVNKITNAKTEVAYYNLFDNTQKASRKFGNYTTDGTLAFVEKKQNGYSQVFAKNAASLTSDNGDVIFDNNGQTIKNIGIKVENKTVEIETEDTAELDLTALKVYSAETVTKAYINGQAADFAQVDNYVYFRTDGLPQPEGGGTVTPGDTTDPGHSTGGGGGGGGAAKPDKETEPEDGTVTDPETDTDINNGTGNGGTFSDVNEHWAKEYIEKAYEMEIIKGDGNGNFRPESHVTRAELVSMLIRLIGGETAAYNGEFEDIVSDDWYADYIASALEKGMISKDTSFRPNENVTREEMCKMVVLAAELLGRIAEKDAEQTFSDGASISDWAEEFVKKATAFGLVNGFEDGSFRPAGQATRAQAAAIICRMLDIE